MSRKVFAVSRRTVVALALAVATVGAQAEERPHEAPSATLSIEQVSLAFLASGAVGGGTLHYRGASHSFKLGGLGVGGIGASKFTATGKVYGLTELADFPGPYAEVRTGWAIGDHGKGKTWLRNAKGVMIELQGKRQGAQLGLGADGVVITMD